MIFTVPLVPPGDHTVVVTHEPRSQAGPSKATLRFVFLGNDIVNVPVEAMFTRPVKADPSWIDFRRDGDQGNLTLRSLDARPFRVLSVQGVAVPDAPAALLQEVPWDLSHLRHGDVHQSGWRTDAFLDCGADRSP